MRLSIVAVLAGLSVTTAFAANTRSFVSASGSDANDCSRPTPCRTFQGAYNATVANGEINVLDPAGYGPLTINHAISVVNDGAGSAGVLVPQNSPGIVIFAGSSDAINLRGLIIEGGGIGNTGIAFGSGASLTITNCFLHNLSTGIDFRPSASSTLLVSNSTFVNQNNMGVFVYPSGSGLVTVALNRVEFFASRAGSAMLFDGTNSTGVINAELIDSVAANFGTGIGLSSSAGHAAVTLAMTRSSSSGNSEGLVLSGPKSTVRLAKSSLTGNVFGWVAQMGGALLSYGDNVIDGNLSNETAPSMIPDK